MLPFRRSGPRSGRAREPCRAGRAPLRPCGVHRNFAEGYGQTSFGGAPSPYNRNSLMRLFTGLDLPAEIVGNLKSLLRRLQPEAPINWSPPENLHVTTKFIGEWPEE